MPYTTIGEFSLNLNASLCIGSCKITTLSLTETTYMGINSQGTSGEAKLGKKYGPAAQVTRHEEILIQGIMIQTEMLMKSDKIKRCTYMYIALLFFPSACKDKNKHCKSWASTGECGKNPKYMLFNCSKSCGVCPGMHDAQEVK